jgi:predicted Zn finger-like uncharacterized protein
MAISVECDGCGRQYNLSADRIGTKVKCPKCGQIFTARARQSAAPPPLPPQSDPDDPFAGISALEAAVAARPEPEQAVSAPRSAVEVYGVRDRAVVAAARDRENYRDTESDSADNVSRILILVYLAMFALSSIFSLIKLLTETGKAGEAHGRQLLANVIGLIVFGVVLVPIHCLAMGLTGRMFRFSLPHSAYSRSAACLILPGLVAIALIFGGLGLFGGGIEALALPLAGFVPICVLLLRFIYQLKWLEAIVGFFLGYGSVGVAGFVVAMIVGGMLMAGAKKGDNSSASSDSGSVQRSSQDDGNRPKGPSVFGSSGASGFGPAGQQPTQQPVQTPVDVSVVAPNDPSQTLVESVAAKVNGFDLSSVDNVGPGPLRVRLDELESQVRQGRGRYPNRAEWAEMERSIAGRRRELAGYPPATPPDSINQPLPSSIQPFARGAVADGDLAEEVTVFGYRFRPLSDSIVLTADRNGPIIFESPRVNIAFSRVPRKNLRQQRLYVSRYDYQARSANSANLFHYRVMPNAEETVGVLAGLPATRLAGTFLVDNQVGIRYVALAGPDWLLVEVVPAGDNSLEGLLLADMAVRTLRSAPGEPFVNPQSVDRLAAHFPKSPDRISPVFRSNPAAAEPHVIKYLVHPDATVRSAAIALLPDVASKRSITALTALSKSTDADVAEAAKTALRGIAPDRIDDMADLSESLRGVDADRKRAALTLLGTRGPRNDDERREFTPLLEQMLLDPEAADQALAAAALRRWAGPETSKRLTPILDNPQLTPETYRDNLMTALSGTNDPAAAKVIIKWIALAPRSVERALIDMGPVAEADTVRIFGEQFASRQEASFNIRHACVRILWRIGGTRSLDILTRASRDSRDTTVKMDAADALSAVRQRIARTPATQPVRR